MKKIWLLSIMLACLFLVWCWDDTYIAPWTTDAQNEFAMKEKCHEYEENFVNNIKNEYWIVDYSVNPSLVRYEVFYSKNKNTCIGGANIADAQTSYSDWKTTKSYYFIVTDLLTSEKLLDSYEYQEWAHAYVGKEYGNYVRLINELKGE